MRRILGLDLGTNSIGWAIVDKEEEKISGAGLLDICTCNISNPI